MGYEVALDLGLAGPVFLVILLVAVVILLHILLVLVAIPLALLWLVGLAIWGFWLKWTGQDPRE